MTNRTTPVGTVDEELVGTVALAIEDCLWLQHGAEIDFKQTARAAIEASGLEQLLNRAERRTKALKLAKEALRDIGKWRASCHAHDADMGHEPRHFSDSEDWEMVEEYATRWADRAALTGEHNG